MIEPQWEFKTVNETSVLNVADAFDLPQTIARIMSIRGITSRNDSRVFFYPDLDQLHDPFLMQDMERAVNRILTAISDKQTILVFGDYDVDGTTSAAFLTLFFRSLDVDIHFYIPSLVSAGTGTQAGEIQFQCQIYPITYSHYFRGIPLGLCPPWTIQLPSLLF